MMIIFIMIFLLIISLYHIITTIIGYGILGGENIQTIAIIKELIRIVFFCIIVLTNTKTLKNYINKRGKTRLYFILVVLFGIIISLFEQKSIYSMIIGIKYDFHFLIVFLTSTFIGYVIHSYPLSKPNINIISIIFKSMFMIIFMGFVRQITKFILPNFFENIGYGAIGDFVFGNNPPIYYRTGPGGIARRQGIFAGPNNYGYFLVAFLPIIMFYFKKNKSQIFGIISISIWLLAIGLTISRTALIGAILGIMLFYKNRIQILNKKTKKILLTGIAMISLITIVTISIVKRGSTKEHIVTKINGISNVINKPLGHGLGTAGPAIHHEGYILPENYYIQLMVDIGSIGFILWTLTIFSILQIKQSIINYYKKEIQNEQHNIYTMWKYLSYGRGMLFIMGLFLHVFEDSMINYLFFVPYGLLSGYLSYNVKINKKSIFTFINKLKTIK